jgi:hypothetical protein
MQEVGMTSELKAMWCTFIDGHDDKNHLEQVSDLICCHPHCLYFIFCNRKIPYKIPLHYRNLALKLDAFRWFLKFLLFGKKYILYGSSLGSFPL